MVWRGFGSRPEYDSPLWLRDLNHRRCTAGGLAGSGGVMPADNQAYLSGQSAQSGHDTGRRSAGLPVVSSAWP